MPDEDELRGMLRADASGSGGLDADRVIRLARRRRRPRVLAAGAVGALAAVAIVVPVAIGVGGASPAGTPVADGAESAAEQSREHDAADAGAHESTLTAESIGACGDAVPAFTPDPDGLELRVDVVELVTEGGPLRIWFELVNTGDATARGSVSRAPDSALVADGVVVANAAAATGTTEVMLEPGETRQYSVVLPLDACGTVTATEPEALGWIVFAPADGSPARIVGSSTVVVALLDPDAAE